MYSNFNLGSIPSGLLQPLQHLTKLPSVNEAPLSENIYESLQPFLSIYLPGNSLQDLHHELFELSGLKVLSVRNNKLHELPFSIQRLTALEVLNVAVNQLTYLPWELLKLFEHGELKHFTACPNPFPSIEGSPVTEWHRHREQRKDASKPEKYDFESESESEPIYENACFDQYEGTPPPSAWAAIHVATGPIKRLDMEGRAIEESSISSQIPSTTRAPSLREVALRAVCKLPDLDHVTDEDLTGFPLLLVPLIKQVKKIRAAGGQQCSVCRKEYIIPRTEWLEWWDCTPYENGMKRPRTSGEELRPLPFKRFGCSWSCVPESS